MRSAIAAVVLLSSCSPAAPPSFESPRVARGAKADPSAVVPDRPPAASAPNGVPAAPVATTAAALPFTFERVEPAAVTSLAAGKPPKIAALLAGEALVFDGASFSRLPTPDTRAPELAVEIFFGRDDQPRLMGTRGAGASRVTAYYRRFKAGRFQPEPSELGPLAGAEGALYGVLGHADPEVVCRPEQFCLVKRTTGWGRAPAHAEPVRIVLAGTDAWALHRDRIERLDGGRWVAMAPERPWKDPESLSVDASGVIWVVEAGQNAVTRLAGGRWETLPIPLEGPRAIVGTGASDLWVVGAGGAVHFDGKQWASAPGVSGALALVLHAPPNLWFAGASGLFRGSPAKTD